MADSTAPKPLSARARRFVDEYLVDLKAGPAAERAGFSAHTAYQAGNRLLRDDRVKTAISAAMAERAATTRIQSYRILEELATIALSNLDHYWIDEDGHVALAPGAPRDAMRAVSSVKRTLIRRRVGKSAAVIETIDTEIKLWDKNPALSNAMRHLGIQGADKVDHRDVTLEQLIAAAAAEDTDGDSAPPVD